MLRRSAAPARQCVEALESLLGPAYHQLTATGARINPVPEIRSIRTVRRIWQWDEFLATLSIDRLRRRARRHSEPLGRKLSPASAFTKSTGMSGVGADIIAQCIGMKQADIIVQDKGTDRPPIRSRMTTSGPRTKAALHGELAETGGLETLPRSATGGTLRRVVLFARTSIHQPRDHRARARSSASPA